MHIRFWLERLIRRCQVIAVSVVKGLRFCRSTMGVPAPGWVSGEGKPWSEPQGEGC